MDFSKLKQSDAAAAIGVSTRTLRRWEEDGCPRNADGSYNLPAIVEWLLNREGREANPEDAESSKWLSLYRKERYLLAKIEREKTEGELIAKADILDGWIYRLKVVRDMCLMWRDRLPPLLEGKSKREIRTLLDFELRHVFSSFAQDGKFTPSKLAAEEILREAGTKRKWWGRDEQTGKAQESAL